jgi:hypothetical protein
MRSFWLVSAAFVVSAGLACAQTLPPTPEASPGTSPGTMAPQNPAPANSSATSGSTGMTHPMHHNMSGMPANGSADTYMHIAQTAVRNHNKAQAEEALSRAETRLLTRAVPQSSTIPTDDAPAVKAIENARAALRSGDMQQASTDIDTAMRQMHHGAMSGMGNPSSMSTPSGMNQ